VVESENRPRIEIRAQIAYYLTTIATVVSSKVYVFFRVYVKIENVFVIKSPGVVIGTENFNW
jgi:hypothetical protein